MKKLIALGVFVALTFLSGQAFASLNDTRASVLARYGEYRLVVDTDGQLWTKAEWESGGSEKAKAGGYMYYFTRNGIDAQMEVLYDGDKPESVVKAQRITPDAAIQIKDFQKYFPEFYALAVGPKTKAFATEQELTRNFREQASPVSLGIVNKASLVSGKSYYTLLAFNINDQGRLVKDAKYINNDTYIREFTVERVWRIDVDDLAVSGKDWEWLKNPFM